MSYYPTPAQSSHKDDEDAILNARLNARRDAALEAAIAEKIAKTPPQELKTLKFQTKQHLTYKTAAKDHDTAIANIHLLQQYRAATGSRPSEVENREADKIARAKEQLEALERVIRSRASSEIDPLIEAMVLQEEARAEELRPWTERAQLAKQEAELHIALQEAKAFLAKSATTASCVAGRLTRIAGIAGVFTPDALVVCADKELPRTSTEASTPDTVAGAGACS